MAEPAREMVHLAEPVRHRRTTRDVPHDWFMDPVDSGIAAPSPAPDLTALADPEVPVHEGDASTISPSIWQAVAGSYGIDADEGELAWQTDALCAQTDPEAFFPEKGGSTRDAKRVCAACPVSSQCLEYAMSHDEKFGIWGGLSERERRRLRRAGR